MTELPNLDGGVRGRKSAFRALVVCICISALVMTVYSQEGERGPIHTLRSGVQWAVSPLQGLGSAIEQPFDALQRSFTDANASEETLTELRNRNATLVAQLSELQVYKQENEDLKAMLGLASSVGASGVAAQVVATSQDNLSSTLTINRGSDDGVGLDMPVTDGTALVGQVCAVTPTTATVRLVDDPSFSMSVSVGAQGATGILSGSIDSTVRVDYVGVDYALAVGDIVSASGVSDVYPQGLPVGTVASVSSELSDLYQDVVVTPLTQAGNASNVFVITSYGESASSDSSVAAQDGQDVQAGDAQ